MRTSHTIATGWRHRVRRRSATGLALATLTPALAAVTLGAGVVTAPAANAAPAGCTIIDGLTTGTFDYVGAQQDWVVPPDVTKATFTVVGAAGGNAGGRPGGRGGALTATIDVTPGTAYKLFVGGKGGNDTDPVKPGFGGWNGGAHGAGVFNPNGGGGGGASDIRTTPYTIDSRVLVAGGGGGAGSAITYQNAPHGIPGAGGAGSGTGNGSQGENVSGAWVGAGGGGGATDSVPGMKGGPSSPLDGLYNGCGFWSPAYPTPGDMGGLGHSDNRGRGGVGGHLYQAGSGQRCDQYRGWGGGGGGGWYGGGGGGGGITGGAGGGGGSGHAPAGATSSLGSWGASGLITVTYSAGWQTVPGGGTMTSAPTVTPRITTPAQPVQRDIFYLNKAGQLIQRVVTNGVASPEYNLGGTFYAGSTVAAAWRPDGKRLDLFGRAPDSALVQKTFTWAGGWGDWVARTPAGELSSDATAVSVDPTRVDVYYRDSWDAALKQLRLIDGKQPEYHTFAAQSDLRTGPAAVRGVGSTQVYYGGRTFDDPGCFSEVSVPDGTGFTMRDLTAQPTTSAPGAVRVGDHVVVAARATGARLAWTLLEDGRAPEAWTQIEAPSPVGSAPALVAAPGGGILVYLRGNDNQLIVRHLGQVGAWTPAGWPALASRHPSVTSVSARAWPAGGRNSRAAGRRTPAGSRRGTRRRRPWCRRARRWPGSSPRRCTSCAQPAS